MFCPSYFPSCLWYFFFFPLFFGFSLLFSLIHHQGLNISRIKYMFSCIYSLILTFVFSTEISENTKEYEVKRNKETLWILLTFIAKARVDQEHQIRVLVVFLDSYKNYHKIQNQNVYHKNQMKTINNIFPPFASSPLQMKGLLNLKKFLTCLGFPFFFLFFVLK